MTQALYAHINKKKKKKKRTGMVLEVLPDWSKEEKKRNRKRAGFRRPEKGSPQNVFKNHI
jgi:hypothetical protein